jgi:threonine dehydratase
VSFDESAARAAIARIARRTPLVPAPALGEGIWLKLESLQRTGSFKLRGACAALAQAGVTQVVTASAGNHGLGTARAAQALGKRATVVVSRLSPPIKRDGIAALGAEVLVEGANYDEAEAFARELAQKRGLPFLSAFDEDAVIFGNGQTTGEEIRAELPKLAHLIVPLGGGGLMAGLTRALGGIDFVGVQPEVNCAMHESLKLGRALTRYQGGETLCEGLEGATGAHTFEIVRAAGIRTALVSERAIRDAVVFAYRTLGLIVEPSAAVGIAAIREGVVVSKTPSVVVISGSNIEPELLDELLATPSP